MTIPKIKVSNMESPQSYRPVANQFIIETPEGEYFQSYQTIIAYRTNGGQITLDRDSWNYSVTTSKYRNIFLRCDTKSCKARIADGTFKLDNLN